MKTLKQYIIEAEDNAKSEESNDEKTTERNNIKFTIWESPDKKVPWLDDNEKYQKIEYKYENKDKNIYVDFLLGYVKKEDTWKLWTGKIGATTYDEDPYCDFKTNKFSEAIIKALDKVEEMLDDIKEDPYNYIQYYKDI